MFKKTVDLAKVAPLSGIYTYRWTDCIGLDWDGKPGGLRYRAPYGVSLLSLKNMLYMPRTNRKRKSQIRLAQPVTREVMRVAIRSSSSLSAE